MCAGQSKNADEEGRCFQLNSQEIEFLDLILEIIVNASIKEYNDNKKRNQIPEI